MQEHTSWGALRSPDGEYWWDGTAWRPMYTPDRQHMWTGEGWQQLTPAPEPAGTGRPSWLPAGVSPMAHAGVMTPAYGRETRITGGQPVAASPRPRLHLGAALVRVVALLVGLGLAIAVAGGGYLYYQRQSGHPIGLAQPTGLAGMVVQPSDLPGVKACPTVSFNQQGYLAYLQEKHPDQYQSALDSWNRSRTQGLVDAYYIGYADNQADCDKLLLGGSIDSSKRSALSMVFKSKDEASALTAYQQSSLTVPSFVSTQKGTATGLGPDSTIAYAEIGNLRSYLAVWHVGRYGALISTTGLTQAEAKSASLAVSGRMR